MTPSEVDRWLPSAPGWRRVGKTLVRDIALRDFDSALRLVERVGQAAVDYQRRPDMCISEYNRVRLRIFNLHHAGLTEAELRLAARTSEVVDAEVVAGRPAELS